jgi:hypothetical protein
MLMTLFTAHYRSDAEWTCQTIHAGTPELALGIARHYAELNADDFDCHEIEISAEDGSSCAIWRDEEQRLRFAARDLLNAARLVIERWEKGDLAEAVRELSAAVAKAEGGAK